MSDVTKSEELLDKAQAAKFCRKSPRTLDQWRRLGRGPNYFRVGGSIYYRAGDLMAFLQAGYVDLRQSHLGHMQN